MSKITIQALYDYSKPPILAHKPVISLYCTIIVSHYAQTFNAASQNLPLPKHCNDYKVFFALIDSSSLYISIQALYDYKDWG